MQSRKLTKLQKVVPKGAQCKFSAQKSFQRDCIAKYRRNIRRRSSKVVPKGMQNLYRRKRRWRSSKDVPKGMHNLYHQNRRWRSSKDVSKGMQNLYRRNRRRRSSKVVPKGMQNLHRKINGEHRKINGEEAQKSLLRGCRVCVLQCGCVGVCLRH